MPLVSWIKSSVGCSRAKRFHRSEKVFSIFEPHTRWVVKGKAGVPVELGVPVCVVEDQFQFLLHHKIMWQGTDVDVAVSMVEETQARFAKIFACAVLIGDFTVRPIAGDWTRCWSSKTLPLNKGYLSQAEREREQQAEFAAMRRQHPAVDRRSTILSIEVWSGCAHGAGGFERTVALAVVAANLQHWSFSAESAKSSSDGKRRVCAPPEAAPSNSATARTLPFRRERLPMPVFWGMTWELAKSLPNGTRCRLFDSLHCEK